MEYTKKSEDEQKKDLEILARIRWREDLYFHALQLRTKLVGVDTYEKVSQADRTVSWLRTSELKDSGASLGNFDLRHLCAIHEHLFQDIYYFAGKLRNVNMMIDEVVRFEDVKTLPGKLDKFFNNLKKENNLCGLDKEKFVSRMADCLTDINMLHPFREGNGRAKRLFFTGLAEQAGYHLDWDKASKEEWLYADESAFDSSKDGKRNTDYLKVLLDRAVVPLKKTTNSMQDSWDEFMKNPGSLAKQKSGQSIKTAEKENVAE